MKVETKINTKKWKVSLPMYPFEEISDDSTETEYGRCPRRGFIRYGLRRGSIGVSYPIKFGLAYHKYRELAELAMKESGSGMTDAIHEAARTEAAELLELPPADSKWAYLNMLRLYESCNLARTRIEEQMTKGTILVTRSEDSFDIELPFVICLSCGWTSITEKEGETCIKCREGTYVQARHGGRVDQFIKYITLNDKDMIKDFKSTSRMGDKYKDKFNPSSQMQGYKWGGEMLRGEEFEVLVETLYNTKTKGPEIHQHHFTYTRGQQEAWLASRMMERQMIVMMWSRVEELGYLAFPQRTIACQDFGRCPYFDLCEENGSSAYMMEKWLENYTVYSHWDFADPDAEESEL